jgi:hypothetical protein
MLDPAVMRQKLVAGRTSVVANLRALADDYRSAAGLNRHCPNVGATIRDDRDLWSSLLTRPSMSLDYRKHAR